MNLMLLRSASITAYTVLFDRMVNVTYQRVLSINRDRTSIHLPVGDIQYGNADDNILMITCEDTGKTSVLNALEVPSLEAVFVADTERIEGQA